MKGTLLWVGTGSLLKEVQVLQFVTVEVTRNEDTLTPNNNNLVSLQQILCNGGGKTTHKVALCINDADLNILREKVRK